MVNFYKFNCEYLNFMFPPRAEKFLLYPATCMCGPTFTHEYRCTHAYIPAHYANCMTSLTTGNDLEVLYGSIRHKLAVALNNWHPSDSSAHKILEPWIKVTIFPVIAMCMYVHLHCVNILFRCFLLKQWTCLFYVQFCQN